MTVLDGIEWARPVVRRLLSTGGITPDNKPRMFEVRAAYELHLAGVVAEYEHRTGAGDASVDFRVPGDPAWLIEVFSLGKTEGMRRATHEHGLVTVLSVGDAPGDPKQTEVGELLTTQGKIAEKARKFPPPTAALHVILVDTRAYLDNGADALDARELIFGRAGLPREAAPFGHWWEGKPVLGL